MTVLEAAAQERGRWSPRALVEWCWRELDGAGCTPHPAGAAAFFERLDHASGWDAAALGAALDGLFAPDEHAPQGRVQIMTVHQAKGLEFDAVILPGLGRRLRPDKDGLLRWAEFPAEGDFAWLMAPQPARGTEERTVYGLIKQRDQEKKRQEQRRLLYVGMTRARQRLHLVAAMPLHPSTGQLRAPDGGSPLACVWATLQPEFERQFQQHRSQAGLAAHEALSSTLAPAAGFPLLRRVRVVPAAAVAPAPAAATVGLQNLQNMQGALAPGGWERGTGTAVHALLRRLAESGVRSWSAAQLDHQLRSAGVLPADLPLARERAERALRHTLGDARGRWILDRHPGARCEWAIAGATPGGAAHRVIDRSFIAADGTHWIIDYKITEPGPGAQAAAWLEAERERYQPQLAAYAQLVAALDAEPRPWRCGLYFPLTGAWLEWGG
jgi:ATP-dependent exoDNAse (exonuclease V) beta subunit